ncbi:MAG: glycosyltransferase family 2 protein [Vicinamibacterales bacterium]|nr:glycosyltransferase family 2 protein [Vicinamibacterales bacterium]
MIWIVLPAYNEAQALPKLLPRLDAVLRERGHDYRLVVVDDGSSDATPEILEGFRATLPLDIVTHPINRGLGETERDGFEYVATHCAPDDVIVRVEGDDTHDPAYIFVLLEKLASGFDVVNTSRFQPGGAQRGVSTYRAFISRCANLFMKVMFPIPGLWDFSCGFRAYRARVIIDAVRVFGDDFVQLRGMGFTSTLEMVVKLSLLGCRFAEVPFVLRYDMKESGSKMVGSITTLGYLLMALLYHWPFGGWRSRYRGLAAMYRQDPEAAVAKYQKSQLPRQTASGIRL